MKFRIQCFLGIFLGLLLISACQEDPAPSSANSPQLSLDQAMDQLMEKSDLPGLAAVAINREGKKISYTHGTAIWEVKSRLTTNHIFRIASMTKMLTSIAALQLVEQGLVGLDDDLSEHLPRMAEIPILEDGQLRPATQSITLRHLLTHSSGFGYSITDKQLSTFDREGWEYEDHPRRFEPGTQFLYGTSIDWVGKLVEKLSGLSLEDYFRKHITGPLGMDRTWYNVPDSLEQYLVSFGNRGDDGEGHLTETTPRIPNQRMNSYYGGGGLKSSPEDYTKLLFCLLNNGKYEEGQLLEPEMVEQMFQNQIGDVVLDIEGNHFDPAFCCNFKGLIPKTAKWGLAFMLDTEDRSTGRSAGTALWGGVYNTYFFIDRKAGIAASIYTQHLPFNHSATTSLFDAFTALVYKQDMKL